jgi:cyclase
MEMFERPAGYVGPDLNPSKLRFRPRAFADGVYALLATPVPRDNSGLIVGSDAALLVDAGINGSVARALQQLAARLTRRPLKYLVNTNYHGDHTFGNYAFPSSVEIIAHRATAASMADLDYEKRVRSRNLVGHEDAVADVTVWRKPDRVFDDALDIDLGNRIVQLRHFGPGNTPGDTIVCVPDARIAWTGNFVSNERIIPMLLEIGPRSYAETLRRAQAALDVDTIVPGHGPLATPATFGHTIRYLEALERDVRAATAAGGTAADVVDALPLPNEFALPWWFPNRSLRRLMRQFQRLNVLFVYRELERERAGVPA